ncbi:uncharacterized protein LOC107227248 [Neodiprion lecontei]|uniref:Uncharacterized protein LOC107227248 n=1 Tax=Neodiprion lecontei TaxID=441921 RepID=A0A6J0CCD7_NEOLC|nr:uncharacterized protein LOC107227248 [Neodiprion lecontei]
MTVKVHGWIWTILAMGYLVCLVCTEDNQTVCHKVVRNLESHLIPYQSNYTETCWLFLTCARSRTKYINESYMTYRLEKKYCDGFRNASGTCQDLRCKKRANALTCDCENNPGECLHTCKTCYQRINTKSQCHKLYYFGEDKISHSASCPKVCGKKWRKVTKVCNCPGGYVSNGAACQPECKQGCLHGICQAPNYCKCYCGWGGPSCGEAQLCLVASPIPGSDRDISQHAVLSKPCIADRSYAREALPACHQKCPEELYKKAAFYISPSKTNGLTYYLIPIYTNCSTTELDETFLEKHNNLIAGVMLGILASLAIIWIFYIACIVKQKRRTESMPSDKIVQYNSNEFMEENSIYVATTNDN